MQRLFDDDTLSDDDVDDGDVLEDVAEIKEEEKIKRDDVSGSPVKPAVQVSGCPIDVIRILVLHGHTGGKRMWDYFAKNWPAHGPVQIEVTRTKNFDIELLQRVNPDIIVCSDIAGSPYELSFSEMTAIKTYVNETTGKHVLGTYATFYHREGPVMTPSIYDNRDLAPLFGFRAETDFGTKKLFQNHAIKPRVCSNSSHNIIVFNKKRITIIFEQ